MSATPGTIFQKRSVQRAVDAHYGERKYEVTRRIAVNSTSEQVWEMMNCHDPAAPLTVQRVIRRVDGILTVAGLAL